jgi:hypothetical protein
MKIQLLDTICKLNDQKPFWQFYLNVAFEEAVLYPTEKMDYKEAVAATSKAIDKAISENLVKFDCEELQICCMNVLQSSRSTISFAQNGPFDNEMELKKFSYFVTGFLCGLGETDSLEGSVEMCHKDMFKIFKKILSKHLTKQFGKGKFEIIC